MMILKNMGKKKEKLNNKNTPEREKMATYQMGIGN